jgi:hypothetical protein
MAGVNLRCALLDDPKKISYAENVAAQQRRIFLLIRTTPADLSSLMQQFTSPQAKKRF